MIKRLAISFFILILLTPVAAYLASPQLLNWQIHRLIEKSQCQNIEADFSRPDWHFWQIDDLKMTGCQKRGFSNLKINHLELHYDAGHFFKTGRIQTLDIQGLEIDITPRSESHRSQTSYPIESDQASLNYWLGQLPLTSARIDLRRLTVHAMEKTWDISGDINLSSSQLESQLTLTTADVPPILVKLTANDHDQIALHLGTPDQQLYQLNASLKSSGKSLRLEAQDQINLEPTIAYLRALGLLPQQFEAMLNQYKFDAEVQNQWQIESSLASLLATDFSDLNIDQQLTLNLDAAGQQQPVEKLTATLVANLNWNPQQLSWQLLPESNLKLQLASSALPHPELSEQWQLSTEQLSGQILLQPQLHLNSEQGKLIIRSKGDKQLQIGASLSEFGWQAGNSYGHFESQLNKQKLRVKSMTLSEVNSVIRGQFAHRNKQLSLNLNPGSYLSTRQFDHPPSTIQRLNLVVNHALQLQYDLQQNHWQSSPVTLNLASDSISHPSFSGRGLAGELSIKLTDNKKDSDSVQALTGKVDITLFNPGQGELQLPDLGIKGPYQLHYPILSFDLDGTLEQLKASIKGNAELLDRKVEADWHLTDTNVAELWSLLPASTKARFPDLNIQQGTLTAEGQFRFSAGNNNWLLEGDGELSKLEAEQGNWLLSGGRSLMQFSHNNHNTGQMQGGFWADSINGPIALDTLSSGFSLNRLGAPDSSFKLYHASLRTLGGNLALTPLSLPLAEPKTETQLFLSNIDMQQLLALQPKAEIAGSGRLNGKLPIKFDSKGLKIKDGTISAQPPGGHLSYIPPGGSAAAATNYGLDIAMKALSNFNYHHLSLGVDYQPDGTLLLDTHLKGHNPQWQRGQPIDFNIRIEQNLLKLLQALQFSDKLSDGLDQKIQQHMN